MLIIGVQLKFINVGILIIIVILGVVLGGSIISGLIFGNKNNGG